MLTVSAVCAAAVCVAAKTAKTKGVNIGLAMRCPSDLSFATGLSYYDRSRRNVQHGRGELLFEMTQAGGNFSRSFLRAALAFAVAGTGILLFVGAWCANQD